MWRADGVKAVASLGLEVCKVVGWTRIWEERVMVL